MLQIRQHVFETNSSSVHTMVICTDEEFQRVLKEELLIDYDENLITWDEAKDRLMNLKYGTPPTKEEIDAMSRDELEEALCEHWIAWTYETWGEEYEAYDHSFTTPSGDKMVVFGYVGRDG